MMGKMVKMPKHLHSNKPEEITLQDGRVVKSVQYTDDPKADKPVWTRVIEL